MFRTLKIVDDSLLFQGNRVSLIGVQKLIMAIIIIIIIIITIIIIIMRFVYKSPVLNRNQKITRIVWQSVLSYGRRARLILSSVKGA